LSNARLREQDILITELQEKLDVTEDELKERKKELGELRSKDARYVHQISHLITEWLKSFAVWRKKSSVAK
jgi:ABC-type histidine transport system ATPase subunit